MTKEVRQPTVVVLGASGLLGAAVCARLMRSGRRVTPVARRFARAQSAAFGDAAVVFPIVDAGDVDLSHLLRGADIVVNCVGVLQDTPGNPAAEAHLGFVDRLTRAIRRSIAPPVLVHLSVPGDPNDDRTGFSRSKRAAEETVLSSGSSHVVLRPGFVVAPAAFGGSALVRALAASPFGLPASLGSRPLAVTDVDDVTRTVDFVAEEWTKGRRDWSAAWDVMEASPGTAADVVAAFAARLGGPRRRIRVPAAVVAALGLAGDAASILGWRPALRSTTVAEMRRGVSGDASAWTAATGMASRPADAVVGDLASTVQERWFARLHLLKGLAVAVLGLFWAASGIIALAVSYDAAAGILLDAGFPTALAHAATVASSLVDVTVGVAVLHRRTCRAGLVAGIAVSIGYMAAAAVLTPGLWAEPLGALVKTGPAIVLMAVVLAILDDR